MWAVCNAVIPVTDQDTQCTDRKGDRGVEDPCMEGAPSRRRGTAGGCGEGTSTGSLRQGPQLPSLSGGASMLTHCHLLPHSRLWHAHSTSISARKHGCRGSVTGSDVGRMFVVRLS